MSTLDALLSRVADPTRPLLTHYDQRTGERVELSAVTTANWVAKTANFLVDDLDAEPGTRVRVGLPSHWLRFVWLLAPWAVGAVVVDTSADIGVSGPDLDASEPVRVAASLRPLGGRFLDPPAGFLDLGAEVPQHGDHFFALEAPTPSSPAVEAGGVVSTHAEVLAAAEPVADRLLVEPGPLERDIGLLVGALRGGGSLVVVTGAGPDDIGRLAVQERARIS